MVVVTEFVLLFLLEIDFFKTNKNIFEDYNLSLNIKIDIELI